MAAQAPSEIVDWLADHQFLPAPQVDELRGLLPTMANRQALVKELIRRRWLTPFQATQILADKPGTLLVGPYRVLECIGEGSMGQVFKCWNVRLGRYVAVKMLRANHLKNSKAMGRFRQEVLAASRFDHPNIVTVCDAGAINDRPYMVMDFCEGTNLSALVKSGGPLPIHLACDYVRQAALGLQHAFEQGVVHRDVKPGNLLLVSPEGKDAPSIVKILDFGLARLEQASSEKNRLTQVGTIIGTIDYMAPEQVENAQKADTRADVYSLGATLFFLLAGRAPFTGSNMLEKVSGRLMGEVPNLRESRPDVPPALEAVFQRLMATRPADRYQTLAETAAALAPFAEYRPDASSDLSPGTGSDDSGFHSGAATVEIAEAATDPALVAQAVTDPPALPARAAPTPDGQKSEPGSKRKRWLLLLGGIAACLLLALFTTIGLLGRSAADPLPRADGPFGVMPPQKVTLRSGDHKPITVRVKRDGYRGPVKLQFSNLPDGVLADRNAVIPPERDHVKVGLRVAYTANAVETTVHIIAIADDLHAEASFALVVENPTP